MRKLCLALSVLAAAAVLLGLAARAYRATWPDARLRAGRAALRHGDYLEAEQYAALLETAGQPDLAHLLRGEKLYRRARLQLDAGRPEAAAPLLNQALDEFNQIQDQAAVRLEAAALIGQCLLYLQDLHEAERAFRFVLAQAPDHVDAHRGLAAVYYDQGALRRAVEHLEAVARLDPQDGRPSRLMGLIFKDLDQKARAIDCYQEALRRDLDAGRVQEVRQELAEVLVGQARYAEAHDVLAGCDQAVLESPRALGLWAECFWGLGDAEKAGTILDRALAAHPRAGNLLLLRARLFLDAGDARAAAPLLEAAVEIDQHAHPVRYQLAQAYETLGRTADAAQQRRRCQEIQDVLAELTRLNQEADERPWDAAVRRRLAAVCDKLDKHAEAAMWLQAAAACRDAAPSR